MRGYRRFITAALLAAMAACSDSGPAGIDDPGPDPDPDPDPEPTLYEIVACPAFSPAASAAIPVDRVSLGKLPGSFEAPFFAYVEVEGSDDYAYALVDVDDAGNAILSAPLHPSRSPAGGQVWLWITDGTRSCAPLDFTVEPLPAASGELAAILERLLEVVDTLAVMIGTTSEAVRTLAPGNITEDVVHIALLLALLDHPGNEYSLAAIVNGTSPDAAQSRLDLLEPLLARAGVLDGLAELLEPVTPGPSLALVDGAATVQPMMTSVFDTSQCAASQFELDRCMAIGADAQSALNGARQGVLDEAAELTAAIGLVPGVIGLGGNIGELLVWVMSVALEARAGIYPSSLTGMNVTAVPARYTEDLEGEGMWTATVMAASTGFKVEVSIIQAVIERATLGKAATTLLKINDDALKLLINGLNLARALAVTGLDDLAGTTIEYPPQPFGPVRVSGPTYTELDIVPGTAIENRSPDDNAYYVPKGVGTDFLVVRTHPERFGRRQVTAQAEVTVHRLFMSVSPTEVVVQPDQEVEFTIIVGPTSGSIGLLAFEGADTLQGTLLDSVPVFRESRPHPVGVGNEDTYSVRYKAPSQPDATKPDNFRVRHTGDTGARKNATTELTATATIRFGRLIVTADEDCIEPGEPLQFTAAMGSDNNPDVEWSATAGTISASGLYTSDQPGVATITATLVSKPTVTGDLTIQVGGCTCSFTLVVGAGTASAMTGDVLSYSVVADFGQEGAGVISQVVARRPGIVDPEEGNDPRVRLGGVFSSVAEPAPGTYEGVYVDGQLGLTPPDRSFLGVATVTITAYEPAVRLRGEAIGSIEIIDESFAFRPAPIYFSFNITPPPGSTPTGGPTPTYSCTVP